MTQSVLNRRASTVAWTLCGATLALVVAVPVVSTRVWAPEHRLIEPSWDFLWVFALATTCLLTLGALIVSRLPGNRIGWLMLAVAAGWDLAAMVQAWGDFAAATGAPGSSVATWAIEWMSVPPILGAFLLFPLLFPTGRLPSRRWAPVLGLVGTSMVAWMADNAFGPDAYANPDFPDQLKIETLANALARVDPLVTPLIFVTVGGCLAALAVRTWHSRGIERLQLKWFLFVALFVGAGFIVSGASLSILSSIGWYSAMFGAVVCLPAAMAMAILRYRLYAIDRLISRTVSWLLITLFLGGIYLAVVVALGEGLQSVSGGGSQLSVAASTLIVAALFRPVRGRVQTTVDRRFNRKRYDAARAIEAFRLRVRDEVDLDSLAEEIRMAVHETVQPSFVTLWMAGDPAARQ